ncbi:MAG: hypothetical protein QOH12_922 [Solirubrobacteraceae bacterium]|nr:hypothetical protein [Solirubrobacteraceae bacterium]
MRSVLGRSLVAAITTLACWCAAASAATPATGLVTVRVEGGDQTILAPTTVLTEAGAFHPANDPVAAHACPGTSAAQALELATGGVWSGTYFTSFGDYEVDSILGEAHPTGATDGSYWAFWVNNAPAQVGICQQQLNPGDQILFFPDCFGACPAGFVSPAVLGISAPAVVQSGTPFTASVVAYPNAGGPPKGLVGATITGGGATAATGSGGQATVTLNSTGSHLLSATAPNSVRTETGICVHNGNDGNCGTTKGNPGAGGPTGPAGVGAGTPGAPSTTTPGGCVTNGADGRCGTLDKTAPIARLQIPEGRHYAHGKGPRTLDGTVPADPSGLRTIRLRLTRLNHGGCQVFSPKKATLVDGTCKIDLAPWFSVGPPSPFSYLLKKRLPAGRYVLDVEATDNAGNVDKQVPGRSRIVFRVG